MTRRTNQPPSRRVANKPKTEFAFDPQTFLEKIGQGRTIAGYPTGRIVFSQGDPADAVFYIQKGKIKVTVVSSTGREAVLAILGTTQFFGETCLSQPVRISTATAISEATIMRLEKRAMIRVLRERHELSDLFITHLLSRTIRMEEDLVDQFFNSSEKRLARVLLLLTNFGKEGGPEPVIPNISQQTLAEMIGATRSRVSFFMNKFRKLGFIEYNHGLHVHSSLLSVILLEHEPGRTSLLANAVSPTREDRKLAK